MAQPDAIAREVHTDWFPLLSADHGECAAPVILTISFEVIRIAVGALRASVTSTNASSDNQAGSLAAGHRVAKVRLGAGLFATASSSAPSASVICVASRMLPRSGVAT